MIGLESLRWSLTVVFAIATAFHLTRVTRPAATAEERVSEALHLLMGASMIVMIWPWGAAVPSTWWISGFALSTGWFTAHAVRPAADRAAPVFFATAAATMVWMSAAPKGHHMAGMAHGPDWISTALGAYLVAAALGWVIRGMRLGRLGSGGPPPERPPHWTAVCHGVMSAGMGFSLLAMA
jgi:hypothetical protein